MILLLLPPVAAGGGVGLLLDLSLAAARVHLALHAAEKGATGTRAETRHALRHVSLHREHCYNGEADCIYNDSLVVYYTFWRIIYLQWGSMREVK